MNKVVIKCPACGMKRLVSEKYVIDNNGNTSIICRTCGIRGRDKEAIRNQMNKKKQKMIIMFHCIIYKSEEGRCEKSHDCNHYYECLDKISNIGWNGWTTQT